jgi:hypothetical protein
MCAALLIICICINGVMYWRMCNFPCSCPTGVAFNISGSLYVHDKWEQDCRRWSALLGKFLVYISVPLFFVVEDFSWFFSCVHNFYYAYHMQCNMVGVSEEYVASIIRVNGGISLLRIWYLPNKLQAITFKKTTQSMNLNLWNSKLIYTI